MDRQKRNEFEIIGKYVKMYLYDYKNNVVGFTYFNKKHLNKILVYKWHLSKQNYVIASRKSKALFLQHLILDFDRDSIKNDGLLVDHIDRDRRNNKDENLRITDFTTNAINKGIQSNNTSGYPGVHFGKERGRWEASIKINRVKINLGRFDTREEAIRARIKAEKKYFGYVVNREHDVNTVFKQ